MAKAKENLDWTYKEVRGLGLIVQAEMGLIFIEGACLDADGEPCVMDSPNAAPAVATVGKTMVSSIKAFLDETSKRDLRGAGEYGANGAVLAKLRDYIKALPESAPELDSISDFLSTGNHDRFGAAAAVLSLQPEFIGELAKVLEKPDAEKIEAFVTKVVTTAVDKPAEQVITGAA